MKQLKFVMVDSVREMSLMNMDRSSICSSSVFFMIICSLLGVLGTVNESILAVKKPDLEIRLLFCKNIQSFCLVLCRERAAWPWFKVCFCLRGCLIFFSVISPIILYSHSHHVPKRLSCLEVPWAICVSRCNGIDGFVG